MNEGLLELKDVHHDFGGTYTALRDINIAVRDGEIIALVGPSGCGKTTLLKIMGGLLAPDRGAIYYRGNITRNTLPFAAYVFQDHAGSLLPWRDVASNVALGLESRKIDSSEKNKIVANTLDLVHLQHAKDMMPHELSGGMKQRVALARALAIDPNILLMDEPFSSLDEISRARLQDEILAIYSKSEKKPTIIIVTHNIDEAVYMSHRIAILSQNTLGITKIIENDLAWPRHQIHTRLSQSFSTLRTKIYEIMNQDTNK